MPEGYEQTLGAWCEALSDVYGKSNEGRSPEMIWAACAAHASALGEAIRQVEYTEVLKQAAYTFTWMCAFVTCLQDPKTPAVWRIKDSFAAIVAMKYPGVCGHCIEEKCKCDHYEMASRRDKSVNLTKLHKKWKAFDHETKTLKKWIDQFMSIYGNNIHLLPLEMIGFHFLEEIGEVSYALRRVAELRNVNNQKIRVPKKFISEDLASVEKLVQQATKYKTVLNDDSKLNFHDEGQKFLKERLYAAKVHVVTEVADAFSWLCAIISKVQCIAEENNIPKAEDFEAVLVKQLYQRRKTPRCPRCGATGGCICVFYP